ncbi:MAG: riboflavin synthase [Lachnospiraceae bacterium]|nr:riboflavin synthase [Lachnospiraceae bacterium]
MFTGLIEEVGKVVKINMGSSSGTIEIQAKKVLKDSKIGDSIAVNGVCLTATKINGNVFTADVMAETFRRSSLGSLSSGSYVNLERAMNADGRFGGHIVSGHIDGTGNVIDIQVEENAIWYTISASSDLLKYIVEKGSVALDGISLTVAYVDSECFKVSIIPHTKAETILQYKKRGDIINIECDVIGKYVEKLLGYKDNSTSCNSTSKKSNITMEFLAEHGF